MATPTLVDRFVEDWCSWDRSHALLRADLEVVESTATLRALAADQLLRSLERENPVGPVDRDLLNAFGLLGRIVGERGGSPTLAAAIVDGARRTLDALDTPTVGLRGSQTDAPWVMPARAALAEAYAAARRDAARADAATRWEYPRCAVSLDAASVAIAAGYPEDDLDELAAWASRVAQAAAFAGVRKAVVSGSLAAKAALGEALDVAGIEHLTVNGMGHEPTAARPRVSSRRPR